MSLLLLFDAASAPSSITGTASITLGPVTLSSQGNLPLAATLSATLGAITMAAQGNLPIAASASITLGAITAAAQANLPIAATVGTTLGAITLAAQGNLPLAASLAATLGAVTFSAQGNLPITAGLSQTLGAVTMAATGGGGAITATLDVTLGPVTLAAQGSGPSKAGGFGDWAYPVVHRQGDTRWDGVREAREEARRLFDEVAATTPAKRKDAAARASDAVAKVARTIKPPVPLSQPLETGQWDSLLEGLQQLQAYLAGLAEQDRIKAAQAQEAADRWALIEREMALEAAQEEELMVVLAMAL